MTPEQFLDEICAYQRVALSPMLRESILGQKKFSEAALSLESFPVESVMIGIGIVSYSRGGCPVCGGRTVPRSGVHFDSEDRCVVCHWKG